MVFEIANFDYVKLQNCGVQWSVHSNLHFQDYLRKTLNTCQLIVANFSVRFIHKSMTNSTTIDDKRSISSGSLSNSNAICTAQTDTCERRRCAMKMKQAREMIELRMK